MNRLLLAATLAATGAFHANATFRGTAQPKNLDAGWSGHVFGRHLVAQHVIGGKPWKGRRTPLRLRRAAAFQARRLGHGYNPRPDGDPRTPEFGVG